MKNLSLIQINTFIPSLMDFKKKKIQGKRGGKNETFPKKSIILLALETRRDVEEVGKGGDFFFSSLFFFCFVCCISVA